MSRRIVTGPKAGLAISTVDPVRVWPDQALGRKLTDRGMKKAMGPRRIVSSGLAALAAVGLSACTNLDAVRTFAKTSAVAVENKEVLADYARGPVVLARLAPPDRAAALEAQAKERAKQRVASAG